MFLLKVVKVPDTDNSQNTDGNSRFPSITVGEGHLFRILQTDDRSLGDLNSSSQLVCIIAVPKSTPIQELLELFGDTAGLFSGIHVVASPTCLYRYTVVLECLSQETAESVILLANGRQIMGADERMIALQAVSLHAWATEECHIEAFLDRDKYIRAASDSGTDQGVEEDKACESLESKEILAALVELPTCPVCLDRIDPSSTGVQLSAEAQVLTTQNSAFEALQAWPNSNCLPCSITLSMKNQKLHCHICGKDSDLWVCLICGHLGCARYSGEHAKRHFSESNHAYSLELKTQRIWDYIGDRFVHRVCQTEDGQTLIEFDRPHIEGAPWISQNRIGLDGKISKDFNDIKMDGKKFNLVAQEYNILLQSELEEQQRYYEDLISQIILETEELKYNAEELDDAGKEEVSSLRKQVHLAHLDHEQYLQELREAHETIRGLRSANKTLLEKHKSYKEQVQKHQLQAQELHTDGSSRKAELEQQIQDLAFYLKTQSSIRISPQREELEAGVLVLQERESPGYARRKQSRKKTTSKN